MEANRLPLESLTGTDLIYYSVPFQAFVMVQYKMMECQGGSPPIFRLPSVQLDTEIARMAALSHSIAHLAAPGIPEGFRLHPGPFFIKFCPRLVFEPEDSGLAKGMYVPLKHFELLNGSNDLRQPRGGKGITFQNVGRHLDNTGFATLVSGGWIGTFPNQSSVIGATIDETLSAGRAAIVAIQTEIEQFADDEDGNDSAGEGAGGTDKDLPF